MIDEEINEAVARKLGYTKDFDFGWIIPQRHKEGFMVGTVTLPDFCHSIEAAWEILDKYGFILSRHPGGYTCTLIISGSTASSTYREDASAKTAPTAICLAFLKMSAVN